MPELPDLQVFSANLNKAIKNKTVKTVSVPVARKLNVSVTELKKALEGQKAKKVFRDGKELFIQFANDNVLGLHMMLHGGLHLFDGTNEVRDFLLIHNAHNEKDPNGEAIEHETVAGRKTYFSASQQLFK